MSQSQIPASVAAQQKQYVTYTLPELTSDARTITTLEARAILASSGTTGLRTWEAALHLGTFLSSPRGLSLVKKQNVLELGAGTGFISMLCAKSLGAEHVLATDGSAEVMDDMKANLYLNGLEGSVLIDTIALKWGHALIGEFFDDSEAGPRFDVVLGADVVSPTSCAIAWSATHPLTLSTPFIVVNAFLSFPPLLTYLLGSTDPTVMMNRHTTSAR